MNNIYTMTLVALLSVNISIKAMLGTPLHDAIENQQLATAYNLIRKKQYLNEKNAKGLTPLMLAVDDCNEALVSELLQAGADVNIEDPSGNTAYLRAKDNKCVFSQNLWMSLSTGAPESSFKKTSRPELDWGGGGRRRKGW